MYKYFSVVLILNKNILRQSGTHVINIDDTYIYRCLNPNFMIMEMKKTASVIESITQNVIDATKEELYIRKMENQSYFNIQEVLGKL